MPSTPLRTNLFPQVSFEMAEEEVDLATVPNRSDPGGHDASPARRNAHQRTPTVLHQNTRLLLEEWRSRREGGRLPLRTALSPAAFGPLLPQIFVLGLDGGAERLRLAGGLLHDLHGRELRGQEFTSLWAGMDRSRVLSALGEARRMARPVLLRAQGVTAEGAAVGLEIALCPLIGPTDLPDRTIGLYQPTSLTARLMGQPVERLHLTDVEALPDPAAPALGFGFGEAAPPGPSARAALKLVVDNGRRVA